MRNEIKEHKLMVAIEEHPISIMNTENTNKLIVILFNYGLL